MDSTPDKKPPSGRWAWAGLLLVLALAVLAHGRPPDGHDRASLAQYFGRFHPLVVHLPIGLILLAGLLEVVSWFRRWSYLRSAIGFVLGLAAASALVAALDGWLLAWSGGYSGPLVTRHMWAGVWLAAVCLATVGARASWPQGVGLYRLLLFGSLGLMGWTSHEGGALTHGEGFLTEYMPGRLRSLLGIAAPKPKPSPVVASAASATLYAARIVPLLDHNCVSCHGPKKVKGGLRMDTYAGLMKGGEDGSALEPWLPQKSEMIRRVTLPSDDDDFMPSGGKKPLSPDEIKLLSQWIAAGASDHEPNDALPAQK